MFAPLVAKAKTKAAASSTSKQAPTHSTHLARPFGWVTLDQANILQRSIGNQATLRLRAQRAKNLTGHEPNGHNEPEAEPASLTSQRTGPGVSWDFSKIPVFPPGQPNRLATPSPPSRYPLSGIIQSKLIVRSSLAVGEANDPLEHEADGVADRVMRMPDPVPVAQTVPPHIGRKSGTSEEGDKQALRPKREAGKVFQSEAQEKRQPKTIAQPARHTAEAPPIVNDVLRQEGQPLDGATRAFFEPRFGYDLSPVRVHADGRAATAADAVQARAYSVGTDIVFGSGEYQPATTGGKHLLGHELAHTMQQSGGRPSALRRKVKVGAGLTLDTQGFVTSKTGDVYTCPQVVKGSLWNEIFTSLLFSPRVFELDGATKAQIDASMLAHMKARVGIVTFAASKKYSFGAGANFKMNPAFWDVTSSGWGLKPGVDRQKAIDDLNVHPNDYAIACQAATLLTMEGGSKSAAFIDGSSADADDWIPGDWGYIKNIKFPPPGSVPPGQPGLEGENIIYTGKNLFWGHFNPGLEYKTLPDWIAEVNSFSPPTEALLLNQRTSTKVGLK
jgi:hypothetical protein